MHDFFVDRLVHTSSLSRLAESVVGKANQGGGGVHGISQQDVRGGNAVNLAHALARLGLRTLLITHSDTIHERMLREPFEGLDAVVRIKPKPPGLTIAFEGEVNVMLGHGGGAEDFGPELLDSEDWKALRGARVICSVNWAANKSGTRLLAALRGRLGREKVIFFDPADFRDRLQEFTGLLAVIMKKRLVDWMSLNEHEALEAARALGVKTDRPGRDVRSCCREASGGPRRPHGKRVILQQRRNDYRGPDQESEGPQADGSRRCVECRFDLRQVEELQRLRETEVRQRRGWALPDCPQPFPARTQRHPRRSPMTTSRASWRRSRRRCSGSR